MFLNLYFLLKYDENLVFYNLRNFQALNLNLLIFIYLVFTLFFRPMLINLTKALLVTRYYLNFIKFKTKPYTHKTLWRLMASPLPLRGKLCKIMY